MTFGLLFSHASPQVHEDLVTSQTFANRMEAVEAGMRVARAQGVRFMVLQQREGRWQDRTGLPAQQVLDLGVANGFRGWYR